MLWNEELAIVWTQGTPMEW